MEAIPTTKTDEDQASGSMHQLQLQLATLHQATVLRPTSRNARDRRTRCHWRIYVRDTDIFGLSQSKRASLKLVSHDGDEMKWIETKRNENCLVSSVQSTNNLVTSPSLRHSVSCRSITVTRLFQYYGSSTVCGMWRTNEQTNNKQALQDGIVGTVG